MLQINNLHANVGDKPILKGLTLSLNAGEIHAIMGPNGAGKSTLGYVLSGRPGYEVTEGSVTFNGQDLLALEPHERAAAGLFLGFQYPVEIPGVSNVQFLREALNAQRKYRGEAPLTGGEFLKVAREQAGALGMDMDMLKRPVNVGFSGGEKKRNEMVQMGIIDPALAILDETDSGLDIDALRTVGDGINRIMRKPDKAVLLITHYQRLLDYVKPDFVQFDGNSVRARFGDTDTQIKAKDAISKALNPDPANPRAYTDAPTAASAPGNVNGHIIRNREMGDRPEALSFSWDIYLFGAQSDADPASINLSGLDASNDFSSPDGLWFSRPGNGTAGLLWIQTDDGAYTDQTNCMLLAALPGQLGDGGALTVPASASQPAR